MNDVNERAQALIERKAGEAAELVALAAELNQTIADAQAALVALGVKKVRKPQTPRVPKADAPVVARKKGKAA